MLWTLPNTRQILSIAKIQNLVTEQVLPMVKSLWYNTSNTQGNQMKKRMSSSGSKVSIPKWLGTWFHLRYMQDQEKVNGIRPISVVSSHNWSSAGTAWLIEIVIDPKIQLRIDLLHQPAVQGEIDGAPARWVHQ